VRLLDSDGDIDVLSASQYDDKIAWYENDGNENFTSHTITTSANQAMSVYAVDVDGDGDMDVLSASSYDHKIAWYENDGNENFTSHTITTAARGAWSVYAADVDSDGDIDVLSASGWEDKIDWYENDGNENFTIHTITTNADNAKSVYAVDVDGDGDIDVLSASAWDAKIAWYENDGNENFTPHTITTSADGAESVYAVDVDGDGDMDVLSASSYDLKIAWYENLSSTIPVELTSFTALTSKDRVSLNWSTATETNNQGFEIERRPANEEFSRIGSVQGHGTTTEPQEYSFIDRSIERGKYFYRLKQIDFDGSFEYSEEVEVNVEVNTPLSFYLAQNYPNPFNPGTTIKFSIPETEFVTLKVYDMLGNEIVSLLNEQKGAGEYEVEFNAANLPSGSGIYLYILQAGNYTRTKKMILLK